MREEETECIVTPCSECKGGGTRNQILWKERESHEGWGVSRGIILTLRLLGILQTFQDRVREKPCNKDRVMCLLSREVFFVCVWNQKGKRSSCLESDYMFA